MRPLRSVGVFTRDSVGRVIEDNISGTTRWDEGRVVTCTTAGATVIAQHDLGVVPNDIRIQPMVDGNAWTDAGDIDMWSDNLIVFHASVVGDYKVWAGIH